MSVPLPVVVSGVSQAANENKTSATNKMLFIIELLVVKSFNMLFNFHASLGGNP
jgi:hypothetical protein